MFIQMFKLYIVYINISIVILGYMHTYSTTCTILGGLNYHYYGEVEGHLVDVCIKLSI